MNRYTFKGYDKEGRELNVSVFSVSHFIAAQILEEMVKDVEIECFTRYHLISVEKPERK